MPGITEILIETKHSGPCHWNTVGIYGDVEETKYLYGVRHDMVQIYNHQGLPVFQYVVTDNSPHWPPITSEEIGWAFLKQFKKID